ncbi:toprim domain-containing protein [Terracoccus sp. 273MFTsu3.1]|uniref:toprim domain-containing protein n=1 Tax=Terracoccus sp. 273MFTsu3.1 TaxID=1172188 RepID=UPI00035C649D|nr:toprim domain-containing protein [Terracoccus sp. 273MFTsu3.1]
MRRAKHRTRPAATGWEAMSLMVSNPIPGDIPACLDELGVDFRLVLEEAHMKCPAHFRRLGKEDRHPSFSVNIEDGLYNCFSCGFTGKFWELVKELTDMTQEQAVAWCQKRGGVERAKRIVSEEGGLRFGAVDTTTVINEASLALYVEVPEKACATRNIAPDSADHYGVLWDKDEERWIVPIRDPNTGKLWGWQEKNARYFRNKPFNVRKQDTLFGIHQIDPEERTVIVVESPLDVPRGHTAGYDNFVATFGAEITNEQLAFLFERFDIIIWALDNDRAGAKALKAILTLYKGYPNIQRVFKYAVPWDRALDDAKKDQPEGYVKDIGDMTDGEIHTGVTGAVSALTYGRTFK